MFPRSAYREEVYLSAPIPGVYRIRQKWTVLLDSYGLGRPLGGPEIVGPTIDDSLSLQEAINLGVVTLKEPRDGLPYGLPDLGFVGIVGDVRGWDKDGLRISYPRERAHHDLNMMCPVPTTDGC
jgi:hypothetical protein